MWLFVKWTSLRFLLWQRRSRLICQEPAFSDKNGSFMLAGCFPDAVFSSATMRTRHAGGDISPGNEVRREETNPITHQHNNVPSLMPVREPFSNQETGTFLRFFC